MLGGFVPHEGLAIITEQLVKIRENQGGLLTLGMLTALWSSSAAMTAIIDTLNRLRHRGRAAVVEGPSHGHRCSPSASRSSSWSRLPWCSPDRRSRNAWPTGSGSGAAFEWGWKILQWPLVFALVSTGIALVYYFAPDAEQDWVWLTPGSRLRHGVVAARLARLQVLRQHARDRTRRYGVVGGVMVLMLWFYISGLVILIGAEMNAEIEHASPYGKDAGEKVPGEKRRIGTAAMRAWLRRRSASEAEAAERQRGQEGRRRDATGQGTGRSDFMSQERANAREKGLPPPQVH